MIGTSCDEINTSLWMRKIIGKSIHELLRCIEVSSCDPTPPALLLDVVEWFLCNSVDAVTPETGCR